MNQTASNYLLLNLEYIQSDLLRISAKEKDTLMNVAEGNFTVGIHKENEYAIPFLKNGFICSTELQSFCSGFLMFEYFTNKFEIIEYLNKANAGMCIGQNFNEFDLKFRFCCSYFDLCILKKAYCNNANFDIPLGQITNFGVCRIENVNIISKGGLDKFACKIDCIFTSGENHFKFQVFCFTPLSIMHNWKLFNVSFPNYLLCNHTNIETLTKFVENEISSIRFSSINELILKLSVFSSSKFDIKDIIKTPLTNGPYFYPILVLE